MGRQIVPDEALSAYIKAAKDADTIGGYLHAVRHIAGVHTWSTPTILGRGDYIQQVKLAEGDNFRLPSDVVRKLLTHYQQKIEHKGVPFDVDLEHASQLMERASENIRGMER